MDAVPFKVHCLGIVKVVDLSFYCILFLGKLAQVKETSAKDNKFYSRHC